MKPTYKICVLSAFILAMTACVSANSETTDPDELAQSDSEQATDADVEKALEDVGGPIEESVSQDLPPNEESIAEPAEGLEKDDVESYKLSDDENAEPTPVASSEEPLEAPVAEEKLQDLPLSSPAPVEDEAVANVSEPVSDALATGSKASDSGKVLYAIRPGESLSLVAKRFLGSVKTWRELAEFNHLKNPNRIAAGALVEIPVSDHNRSLVDAYVAKYTKSVTVKRGDTLGKIARRVIGTPQAWKYIWKNNENIIANPNRIKVGDVLSYLASPKARAGVAKTEQNPENATH